MARRNRITFGTQMNQHSSRSHALLCISVEGTDLATGSKTTGNYLLHFLCVLYESQVHMRDSGSKAGRPVTNRLVAVELHPHWLVGM